MKRLLSAFFFGAALTVAQAAPGDSTGPAFENMDALLVEKGLITRLGEQLQKAQNSVTERASRLVFDAMGFIGVPYRFGGNSAETGFDCSGFVRAVFAESLGKMLPRRAAQQAAATQVIARSELRPGDLVFFNTLRRTFSHVGIYIGDNKFIHSPRAGASIRIESMDVRYWNTRFDGARRVALLEHPQQTAAAALTY